MNLEETVENSDELTIETLLTDMMKLGGEDVLEGHNFSRAGESGNSHFY
jgi:hypothetical protein